MKIDYDYIPNTHKALIDTGPLKSMLEAYRLVRDSRSDILPQDCARRVKKTFKALTQTFLKVEGFNFRVHLKTEMLKTGWWRARVLADLGGETALKRWAERKAVADKTILAPRVPVYKDASERKSRLDATAKTSARECVCIPGVENPDLYKTRRCQTDRDGLFRLAPIKPVIRDPLVCELWQRRHASEQRKAGTSRKPYQMARGFSDIFKPIPLTPSELRGDIPHNPRLKATPARTGIMATHPSSGRGDAAPQHAGDDDKYEATMAQLRRNGRFIRPSLAEQRHRHLVIKGLTARKRAPPAWPS